MDWVQLHQEMFYFPLLLGKYQLLVHVYILCKVTRFTSSCFMFFLFSTFQLQGSSNCQNDYLEIREGNSTGAVVGRFCGDSLPSNYTSVIGHILWVKFVSDGSVSGPGFRATFSHCRCSTTKAHFLL